MGLFDFFKTKNIRKNNDIKCHLCGVSFNQLKKRQEAFNKQLNKNNIGFMVGSPIPSMLKCKKCGRYSCTKCALDGEEMKRCPTCKEMFDFDSFVDDFDEEFDVD